MTTKKATIREDLFQPYRTKFGAYVVVKTRGSISEKYDKESEGKTRYIICELSEGNYKPLGVLKQYEAVIQFKELMNLAPNPLNRKALKPLKNGQMSAEFMSLIGSNKIANEFEGKVPTIQQSKAYMNAKFKGSPLDY
tara:strand:+ start:224 stop:637 length:414 start_codon:yes stop_codon:yes gene_type:complete